MKTVSYKGFQASVEFEDDALFVRVLHIDDVLVAQIDAASEAKSALKDLVDAYLEDCAELGKEPQRPFSGSFNVRIDRELHRRAATSAAAVGESLNAWVEDAIGQKVECDRFSDRVNNVLQGVQAEIKLLQVVGGRQSARRHGGIEYKDEMSIRVDSKRFMSLVPAGEPESEWRH